jgi:hypothetical protein
VIGIYTFGGMRVEGDQKKSFIISESVRMLTDVV